MANNSLQKNTEAQDHFNKLGLSLKAQGRLDDAMFCFQKAIEIKSDYTEAYYNMGNVFQIQGKLNDAISCYQKALALSPDLADAYYNLGNAFGDQGKLDNAILSFQKAVEIKPDFAEAYNNMGNAFRDQGKLDDAILCYQKALNLKPHDADTYYNIGSTFGDQRRFNEAISSLQKAIELKHDFGEAYNNLGNAFRDQGKLDDAISCYQKALQIKPDSGIEVKKSLLLPVICESREAIEQHRRKLVEKIESLRNKNHRLDDPHKQVGSTNFFLAYHGLDDKEIQIKIASFYDHICSDLVWVPNNHHNESGLYDKIKLGIISKYLCDHTIGKLNYGIIRNLSREKFYLKLFRVPGKEDGLSNAIDGAADEVVVLPTRLSSAREKIAKEPLDILFYLDIGMEPFTYFLAFSRLAPVQCVTWGHPVTTGIPNIDYFISSETAESPGAEHHYTERLILLKRLGIYYYCPELPTEAPSRDKFGLPKDYNLYVCPQSLFKFHPDFDAILGDILRQDPFGLLVLIGGEPAHWTKLLRDRFALTFPDAIDRVEFLPKMPREHFLSLLQVADVVLDTPHFGGGNTSLESFACGVPVVTLPGPFLRSRLTLGLYKQMGVMDCVAENSQAYVSIALKLANDRSWRNEIKERLQSRADVLFEDIEAVHELERFFESAVDYARLKSLVT